MGMELLMDSAMILILAVMYRFHINSILIVVTFSNRVARDLHDEKGSTLSTINPKNHSSINKMINPFIVSCENAKIC
jgi:hypothetical protein